MAHANNFWINIYIYYGLVDTFFVLRYCLIHHKAVVLVCWSHFYSEVVCGSKLLDDFFLKDILLR